MDIEDEFAAFVTAREGALMRAPYLLTGDAYLAKDLLQTVLARLASRWWRIRSEHAREAYPVPRQPGPALHRVRTERHPRPALAEHPRISPDGHTIAALILEGHCGLNKKTFEYKKKTRTLRLVDVRTGKATGKEKLVPELRNPGKHARIPGPQIYGWQNGKTVVLRLHDRI